MAAALGDLSAWREMLHQRVTIIEERVHSLEAQHPPPSPAPAAPKIDRTELLREVNSGLRTLLAAILVIAVLLGRVDQGTIDTLKKAVSIAP